MKVPLTWLREYVAINVEPSQLMAKLTSVGHMQDGPAKEIAGDTVYDLEVRQNRSDCLSLIGVAREAAAVLNTKLTVVEPTLLELPSGSTKIVIHDDQLCYRFNTVTLTGLRVGPSPEWLQTRLEAYGMKSVNNIVDATNYVMIELGQPLHAFDLDKLASPELHIRLAQPGEKLKVLGGKEVALTGEDLVIADSEHVVALAGVIGGEESGVSDTTHTIILEAATYNQASIRRSALRHTLRTEASTRLEKFLHPHLTQLALARASQLIVELAGGRATDQSDEYPSPKPDRTVELSLQSVRRLGGIELSLTECQALLAQEMIVSQAKNDQELSVEIPYWRTDLEQEADVVEEVLRLYGYDRIPERLPSGIVPADIQSPAHTLEEQLRDLFVACGFDEQITEPLVNESEPRRKPVRLQNSLSSEKVMLRTSLSLQLLQGATNRRRYRQSEVRLFEVGKVYFQEGKDSRESKVVGAVLTGPEANYFELKGVAETVIERVGRRVEPGIYTIEPIDAMTFVLTIDTEALLRQEPHTTVRILTAPPQLVLEDWSLTVPANTAVGEVLAAAQGASPVVYSVKLGEEPRVLSNERKSVFLKVAFHDPTRTLSKSDTDPVREDILRDLAARFDAQVR